MANKYLDSNGLLYFWQKIVNAISTSSSNKVDKVTGKGLSTEDYTSTEKTKLSGIATGAEVNVQSDWSVTDTTNDGYIKNKPTIPSEITPSSTTPKVAGTAAVGTETSYSRGDHVHPAQTSVSGNAGTATKLATVRSIGNASFDGSANITLTQIGAVATSVIGQANGVCPLGSDSVVASQYLPSYVDDIIEGYYYNSAFYKESAHTTLITGETGKIYVDLSTNISYRYSGSAYIQVTSSDMVAITNSEIDTIVAS